ncbi:MAG: YbeD family protein [Gammaproteobacteria bacterium]
MSTDNTLLEFPCEFPIKVMGRSSADLQALVREVIQRHMGPTEEARYATRRSRQSTYLAVTVTVTARSQVQLDGIYNELSSHEDVIMVL